MHEKRKDLFIVKTKKGWRIVKNLQKELKKKQLPSGAEPMPCMCNFNKTDQKIIKGMGMKYESEMEGGALSQKDLKALLGASYNPTDNVNDFILDKETSSKTSQVYHNPKTGQTVVAHRGTQGVTDWGNNLVYAIGGKKGYKMTPRYKEAEKVQKRAEEKYGAKNVSTIGHSQGGLQAELLGGNSKEIITLNKATNPFENKREDNQYDIRTSGDIVSALNPFQSTNKKEKVIPSKTSNPLTEHSIETLETTEEMIGGKLKSHRKVMISRTVHPSQLSERFFRTPQSFMQIHAQKQTPCGSGLYGHGILDERFSARDVYDTGRELLGMGMEPVYKTGGQRLKERMEREEATYGPRIKGYGILDEKFSVNDLKGAIKGLVGRGILDEKFSINDIKGAIKGLVGRGILDEKFSINDLKGAVKGLIGRGILDRKFSINEVKDTVRDLIGRGILDEKFSVRDIINTGRELLGSGILDEKFSVNDIKNTGRELLGMGIKKDIKNIGHEIYDTIDKRIVNPVDKAIEKKDITGGRLKKGSASAKSHMARIRKMKGGRIPPPPSRSYVTDPSLL